MRKGQETDPDYSFIVFLKTKIYPLNRRLHSREQSRGRHLPRVLDFHGGRSHGACYHIRWETLQGNSFTVRALYRGETEACLGEDLP